MKKYLILFLFTFLLHVPLTVCAADHEVDIDISAKSGILVEADSGKIIMEKNADTKMPPASVTKIMTLLLIFDEINKGKLEYNEEVQVSEYAASMGGSQVFLEAGEKQSVDTMIKCIAVASANDACVAMAEKICGSEESFVRRMNKRAKSLGMKNTKFLNCNGLDINGHLTTARDISLMSRELLHKYPQIKKYCNIWMEDIVHHTRKGDKKFTITNTNKFIRKYEYATGLKTGSTGGAGFCLSASAEKNKIRLIAVVMAEPDSKTRVKDVIAMMNYGYSRCRRYEDNIYSEKVFKSDVRRGTRKTVKGQVERSFSCVYFDDESSDKIRSKVDMKELKAPVKKGNIIGKITYFAGEQPLGETNITALENVEEITVSTALIKVSGDYFSLGLHKDKR